MQNSSKCFLHFSVLENASIERGRTIILDIFLYEAKLYQTISCFAMALATFPRRPPLFSSFSRPFLTMNCVIRVMIVRTEGPVVLPSEW